jgi:hypothetical protein
VKKTIFALAAGIFAMSVSAASAMPTAARHAADGPRATASTGVEPAQYRHHKRGWKHRHYRGRNAYRSDRRYRGNQYRGWKRHYSRPYSWRSRGCVAVGPIWFCP